MRQPTPPRSFSKGAPPPVMHSAERLITVIKRLIWVYFVLLVIEGALRKWAFPQFSNPLLVIRDPIVVLIYGLALRARVFPWNGFVFSLLVLSLLSLVAGLLALERYLPPDKLLFVTLYGYRCNFLHLPLIFVIGGVFTMDDVKRMGRWIVLGMIPMSLLMVLQFQADPEHFLNRTAGTGEGLQITAGGGKIRPPGTFSFVTGAVAYVTAAAAFLLYHALGGVGLKRWLLVGGSIALVVALGVSGSRSAIASVALVGAMLSLVFFFRPDAMGKVGRAILVGCVLLVVLSFLPFFREGLGLLEKRFVESAQAAETTILGGIIDRTFSSFGEGFKAMEVAPATGFGLGVGTSGGARFVIGFSTFLLAENEWSRVILESGWIFGTAFLIWRTIAVIYLGFVSSRALRAGHTLPIFLFGAGFMLLLNGQLGQPTMLGFAALLNGLCLAAAAPKSSMPLTRRPPPQKPFVVKGRSPFAERLHGGPATGSPERNGALDR